MTTKKELIDEIERTANELLGYMDDLQSEVDDAVDEAQDTDTTLERLQEIKQALKQALKKVILLAPSFWIVDIFDKKGINKTEALKQIKVFIKSNTLRLK